MEFGEDFISSINADPIKGITSVCNHALSHLSEGTGFTSEDFDLLIEASTLASLALKQKGLDLDLQHPAIDGDVVNDSKRLLEYLQQIRELLEAKSTLMKVAAVRAHYSAALGSGFHFEFSKGDLERVQTLLNELREHIVASDLFSSDHRVRLLNRIEKLQAELHKKISDLDRFWGLLGDAGVAIGKFGNEAKPFVDRIRELVDIVWRTQARREELPSSASNPVLAPPTEDQGSSG